MDGKDKFITGQTCCPFCEQSEEPPINEKVVVNSASSIEVNHQCPKCYKVWTSFYGLFDVYGIGV